MRYLKHPQHGNKHVSEAEAPALIAAGWVAWPRTKEQKAGLVAPQGGEAVVSLSNPDPVGATATIKRGPGRPRKSG